ncbi:hypothetical protein [Lusitaniella coriacea]|uniref:hypothetical protein n=1 Tax=Lusitaniella coriacea TaxID=1983105 RepID=UPI003CEF650B
MRQKFDFSILVLTSFLVVLALEPVQHLPASQADTRETPLTQNASTPQALELVQQPKSSESFSIPDGIPFRSEAQLIAGAEERILRLLQTQFKHRGEIELI